MRNFRSLTTYAIGMVASIIVLSSSAQAQKPKLSDPEIASVAVVANQVDIGYAEIAKGKSKDADILKFAQTMSNDHNAVIAQASALVKKLGVTPKDNAVSQKLSSDAVKTRKSLSAKSGKAFDKAYIDNEVAYHKAVISTVETVLIPQTENKELKDLLQNVAPTLKAHLEHAEMLQKTISK
jgi:putative membrane protein